MTLADARLTALPPSPYSAQTEALAIQAVPPGDVQLHLVPQKHLLYVNVEQGASIQAVNSDRHEAGECMEDSFALYPAGTDFRLSAVNTGWGIAIEIDANRLDDLIAEAVTDRVEHMDPVACTPVPQVGSFARTLRVHLRGPTINPLIAEGLSLLILGLAMEKSAKGYATTVSVAGNDDRITRAIEYAEVSMHEPLSVSELANVACMSPWHFSRCFSEAIGEPPYRWIQRRRAERAVELIQHSAHSLAIISEKCGFADQSVMGAAVKSLTGLTPSVLRKQ